MALADLAFAWIAFVPLTAALTLYAHTTLRGLSGGVRLGRLGVAVAVALALPWLLPPFPPLRFLAAMLGFLVVMHSWDVAYARYPDPAMHTSMRRFPLYFLNAPDARWPVDAEDAARARAVGRQRMKRAAAMGLGCAALMVLSTLWPSLHESFWLHQSWLLWLFYCLAASVFDLLSGLVMQVGFHAGEVFDNPPLASSPRDFWSRRWNLAFRALAHRLVFLPLGGTRRLVLAVTAVFVFSGVVHEYLVIAALGHTRGDMMIFFTLHGAATLGHGLWRSARGGRSLMPRPLAVAAHYTWMTASSWFFFRPILEVLAVDTFRLW